MTDEEAQLLYPIFAQRAKQKPEKSRALPQYAYRNPERNASFKKRDKGEAMDRLSDREVADSLLIEWHRWSARYRPNLGAPRIAPYCKQSTSSRQYDEDAAYDRIYHGQMEAVDFCIDAIEVAMQQAIGAEMRNREAKAKVWRSPSNRTYTEALDAILPVMRKRGLFD
jgi:hypothetical protein